MRWALLVTLSACGGPGTATTVDASTTACPNDLPSSCPSPAPSYSAAVKTIVIDRCVSCHGATGSDPSRPFDTYAELTKQPGAVLDQVYACTMPQAGAPMLLPAERQALLGWLVCGAPEN